MVTSWLNLLSHDLIGIVLLWLMTGIWSQGAELKQFAGRWPHFLARQCRQQARVESRALPGLAHQPGCADCQAEANLPIEPLSPPPPWPKVPWCYT